MPEPMCVDCKDEEASYDGQRCRDCAHADLQKRLSKPSVSTDEQYQERIAKLLAAEARTPECWYLLSFVDESGFLGATVLRAQGMLTAIRQAHKLGINPGGEVMATPMPAALKAPPDEICEKLIQDKTLFGLHFEGWMNAAEV